MNLCLCLQPLQPPFPPKENKIKKNTQMDAQRNVPLTSQVRTSRFTHMLLSHVCMNQWLMYIMCLCMLNRVYVFKKDKRRGTDSTTGDHFQHLFFAFFSFCYLFFFL